MKDLFFIQQPRQDIPISAELNDLEIVDNDILTVEGPARKVQDILKILITRQGANTVYPDYGSVLPALPTSREGESFNQRVRESVIEALGFLQEMEESQDRNERIRRIRSLRILETTDPRAFTLILEVELENGNSIRNDFPI